MALLDRATDKSQHNIAFQLFKLTAFQALKDDAGVEGVLKKLIEYYPAEPRYRDALASWYVSKGRKDDAEATLRDFRRRPIPTTSRRNLPSSISCGAKRARTRPRPS